MNYPILSFNSGYFSPKIDARSDTEKYGAGCRIIENMFPLVYGCAVRRPGTKYVYGAKSNDTAVRLIPFIYSSDIAYMTEFGDEYIRFYYDGSILLDPTNPVEVATSYVEADLFALHTRQIADTMWIVHSGYAPAKLTRTSVTVFSLDDIAFTKGPFLTRNDIANDDDVTMTSSVTTVGTTGTLTASSSIFESGHVGAIFKLIHPRTVTSVSASSTTDSDAIDVKGTFRFDTHGTWTGTVKLQRNENDTDWDDYRTYVGNGDRNIQLSTTEKEDNVQYKIVTPGAMSAAFSAEINIDNSIKEGIVRIDSISSPTVVNITVLAEVETTAATKRWAEGCWSGVQGYPVSIAFFNDRAVYVGSKDGIATVWLSKTGDYENFEEGLNDDDAFSISLTTTDEVRWVEALDVIVIGTKDDEWIISSNKLGTVITPTNFSVRQQSSFGGNTVQPVKINNSVLFVDFVGRKVREMTYNDSTQEYASPDLTVLAEDITESGIVSSAYQKNPDIMYWSVLDDGTLLSLVYERDQGVVAWSKQPLRSGDSVESVARIPGATEDEIWFSTIRQINGSTKRYIEQVQPRLFDSQSDCFFVDCGIIDISGSTTITGLSHLEGETVKILGDGAVYPDKVVDGGQITISEAADKCIVGLPYTYRLSPMRMDIAGRGGTTKGSIKKIAEVVISFQDTLNAEYGDGNTTNTIDWRTTEDYGSPPSLFTGDKVVVFDGGFNVEDTFIISGSDPLPCTVRAIIPRIEVTGR